MDEENGKGMRRIFEMGEENGKWITKIGSGG